MNRQPSHSRRTLAILMIGLTIWTALLAIGAFLYGYRQDIRKPIIVFGAMLLFLGVWGALLVLRSARNGKAARSGRPAEAPRVSSSPDEPDKFSEESGRTDVPHSRQAEDG